jgi:hypothetical protein
MKKTFLKKVFYHELSFTIVFHDYIKKVSSLEKSSFLFSLTFKNSIFLKILFLENLDIVIYSIR